MCGRRKYLLKFLGAAILAGAFPDLIGGLRCLFDRDAFIELVGAVHVKIYNYETDVGIVKDVISIHHILSRDPEPHLGKADLLGRYMTVHRSIDRPVIIAGGSLCR